MRCSDAEEILLEFGPDFYETLKQTHNNNGYTRIPVPEDAFEHDDCPDKIYWEQQLTQLNAGTSEQYQLYLHNSQAGLNAFVFFVGQKLWCEKKIALAAKLGNYHALKQEYDEDPTEDNALRLQHFHPQAGDILLAQQSCAVLSASDPTSDEHATNVDSALGALDCAMMHEPEECEAYLTVDVSLTLDVKSIIEDFLKRKLITHADLENRTCETVLIHENKENMNVNLEQSVTVAATF